MCVRHKTAASSKVLILVNLSLLLLKDIFADVVHLTEEIQINMKRLKLDKGYKLYFEQFIFLIKEGTVLPKM